METSTETLSVHTHPRRSWAWYVAAFFLCPCHIAWILALSAGTAIGGALSHRVSILFVALLIGFSLALYQAIRRDRTVPDCPACKKEAP